MAGISRRKSKDAGVPETFKEGEQAVAEAAKPKFKVFVSYTYKTPDGDVGIDRAIINLTVADLRTEGDIGAVELGLTNNFAGQRVDIRLINWRTLEG